MSSQLALRPIMLTRMPYISKVDHAWPTRRSQQTTMCSSTETRHFNASISDSHLLYLLTHAVL